MGQQQLILIVLCTIIVGVAIAVGILIFSADATLAAKDALMLDVTNIVANARTFYIKPRTMGGGGNTFNGYSIPARLKQNENGAFLRAIDGPQELRITAYSNDDITNTIVAKISSTSDGIEWTYTGEFDFTNN